MLQRLFISAFILATGSTAIGQTASVGAFPSALDTQESEVIAREFTAQFGEPTSKSFTALPASLREAAERYFVRGRGAVPSEGMVEHSTTTLPGGIVSSHSPILVYGDLVPGFPGLFNCVITNTGTGYNELFLLQVPDVHPTGPTPLLVVFHKFNVSHGDAAFNTNFTQEARARGWYMLAPLGAVPNNFGSLTSQINVGAALEWTRGAVPIDSTRIYGVGFSMGGGGCATYAARHLDPASSMFAAIVNHTGTVSLAHAYANEISSTQLILEGLFGGSPAAEPFAYQRCSTVDIDHLTETIGVGTDMGRNLNFVHSWVADQDPQPYLPTQTQLFAAHMQALNTADILTVASGNIHSWTTLDDTAACNWLATYTLQEPMTGTTLADQDGVWHRFIVEQDAPGFFTPFNWLADSNANRLSFWATANLRRISVDSGPLGLVYTGTLKLNMSSADGTGDQVLFLHVVNAPTSVTRNGVAAPYTYSHQAQTLLIDEMSGAGSQWMIHF